MFFGKQPHRACPRKAVSSWLQSGRRTPVLAPDKMGGAVQLVNPLQGEIPGRNSGHLQAGGNMALVSGGNRTVPGISDPNTAGVFAAIGNPPMAKVLLIEDDSETAE